MGDLGRPINVEVHPAKIQVYLSYYLRDTPTKYISPTRFRKTFDHWAPAVRERIRIDKQLDRDFKRRKQEPREAGDLERLKVEL
jgi:hypothetical protein